MIFFWGRNSKIKTKMNLSKKIRLISLSILTIISNNVFAQTDTQSLWAWGDNYYGQLGLGNRNQQKRPEIIMDSSDFKSISVGYGHTITIKKDGTLWAWGFNSFGQLGLGNTTDYYTPQQVGTDTTWASVSAVREQTIAIKKETPNNITPVVVNMVRGVLLKEKIPFFAQSKFLKKLLVDTPNIRFGRK